MMVAETQARLDELSQALRDLKASPLYEFRVQNGYSPVFGEGDVEAGILFVGEAPGKNEAQQGRPFVGAAGKVLDRLLASIGLRRQDVYITNLVKDRPPENRGPTPQEMKLYAPILLKQIDLIRPRLIVPLGRLAMAFILQQYELPQAADKISELHGKPLPARSAYGLVTIVPLYHPAVALYNRDSRETLEHDFQVLKQFL